MKPSAVFFGFGLSMLLAVTPCEAQITYPVDFRAGVFTGGTKRNISLDGVVSDRLDAATKGVELMLSPANGSSGIGGRLIEGTFGTESFSYKEGRAFVGGRAFQIEGAYAERSLSGTDSTFRFLKAGARTRLSIGGTGVTVSASGAKYFPLFWLRDRADSVDTGNGWEGETSIFFTAPIIPAYVQLGYRVDYVELGKREEHIGAIILGIGLWLGGR